MKETRRPIKTRNNPIIQSLAQKISQTGMTPDGISILSIVCSIGVAGCFFLLYYLNNSVFALLAAALIQGRLLCNLFDGMVAVEGGKATPVGVLFNEIPDRITDAIIFISAGYAITSVSVGIPLGWMAACLAIFTAYIRVLSTSVGAPTQFIGPMAKSHRMAALTLSCLCVPIEQYYYMTIDYSLLIGMGMINIGLVITLIRRTLAIASFLNRQATHA